jgi:Leucine-rich repeat (LRR) protein
MAGISLILQNNPNVTAINCGTSSPRLGGTIDLSAFPSLTGFTCNNNDITAISGYENNSNLTLIQFFNNKVTGTLPTLSGLSNLQTFRCDSNQLTGPIPSLSGLSNLRDFLCSTNQLTGPIPSLSGLSNLRDFRCFTNQLTGPIPSLNGLSNLQEFSCSNQTDRLN